MPFINLDKLAPHHNLSFDITIIGCGAAGILLALKLADGGKKVCMIESGNFDYSTLKQNLNEVKQTGKFLSNAVEGRRRIVGGTTTAWGGQSLPFTDFDFAKRPWLEIPEWPLEFEEVSKYYKEANKFMRVDELNYSTDIFKKIKVKVPAFDSNKIIYHVAKWAPEPDFKKMYYDDIEKNVTVYYNAQLTKINTSHGRATSITVANFESLKYTLPVNELIIASGGIETVRILLTNDVGDKSGLIGKGFMDHPCIKVAYAAVKDLYSFQRYFNTHKFKGLKYSIRMSTAPGFQQDSKILNCSASFMFLPKSTINDPYAELKNFIKDKRINRLPKIIRNAPKILKSLSALIKHRFFYKPDAEVTLVMMTEQECLQNSSIKLSEEEDSFGVPKANINWDISEKSWETVFKSAVMIKAELERLGLAKINLLDNIYRANKNWKENLFDVNHHMGGARMGTSPEDSVTNKNLQLWGIENTYLCSSAVFPTTSHSNPTLTILALGCRLSKYLLNKRPDEN